MTTRAEIEELDQRFGIAGQARIVAGAGGLAKVVVTLPAATAEIYLHGAQVTSFVPAGHEDVLFLSELSRFEDGRAIRGGVPVCFPWFRGKADEAKAPAHGVVRTRAWELVSMTANGAIATVVFATISDAASLAWWPHAFRLIHRVTIGAELRMELLATNTGTVPMRIEEALHSYHRVGDVRQVRIAGLDEVRLLDNMDGNREKVQRGDVLFTKAMDNAYLETRSALALIDPLLGRQIQIEKEGSATTVVWNPWAEGAKALADLGDDEWTQFACVEASNILSGAVEIAAGATHAMSAVISVV